MYASALFVAVVRDYDRFNLKSLSNLVAVSRDNSLYRLGLACQVIEPLHLGIELSQNVEPAYRGAPVVGKENRILRNPTFG